MIAYDEKSREMLEAAAAALGGSDDVREIIQRSYNLGLLDGRLKQLDRQEAQFYALNAKLTRESA